MNRLKRKRAAFQNVIFISRWSFKEIYTHYLIVQAYTSEFFFCKTLHYMILTCIFVSNHAQLFLFSFGVQHRTPILLLSFTIKKDYTDDILSAYASITRPDSELDSTITTFWLFWGYCWCCPAS